MPTTADWIVTVLFTSPRFAGQGRKVYVLNAFAKAAAEQAAAATAESMRRVGHAVQSVSVVAAGGAI